MQVMNEDIAPTLREQMKHHEPIVCYAIENDPTVKIDTDGVGFSLRAREFKDPQIVCYAEKRFCEWYEDKKGVTLRASSGSYGGAAKCLSAPKNKEKGQNVDELEWSANRSNTNDEQCRGGATNAG